MDRVRTEVEELFLSEMVQEDMAFVVSEDTIDDIIPTNTIGLFDDTSSDDNIENIIDSSELDIF